MRKLAVAIALASTAMASSAIARDDSWYIGLEGGPMIVENTRFDIAGLSNVATVRNRKGFDADAIIGYDFGAFRAEAEVGYREADARRFTSQTTTFRGGPFAAAAAGTFDPIRGKTSALSFMVNGMLDFGDEDALNGFVGGGVGVARIKFNDFGINVGNFLDDSDTRFAYQAIAGIRSPLTDNVDVGLKYRFFNTSRVRLIGGDGRDFNTRFRSHSLLGSFIYNFGAPEVAAPAPEPTPVPPPAPEPTPTPPPVVCQPGPYIVFFEWDKSDVTPEAASILDNAVSAYNAGCTGQQVMLAGFTDTSGTPRYNLGLSQRRADAVRSYMTGRGLSDGVITTRALGETNLRVQTADGVRELQNRRVEITYGPNAGM